MEMLHSSPSAVASAGSSSGKNSKYLFEFIATTHQKPGADFGKATKNIAVKFTVHYDERDKVPPCAADPPPFLTPAIPSQIEKCWSSEDGTVLPIDTTFYDKKAKYNLIKTITPEIGRLALARVGALMPMTYEKLETKLDVPPTYVAPQIVAVITPHLTFANDESISQEGPFIVLMGNTYPFKDALTARFALSYEGVIMYDAGPKKLWHALFNEPISNATDGLIDTLVKWGVDVTVNNEAEADFS